MNKEDKELLLCDLCARLPYGVKCLFEDEVRVINNESAPYFDCELSPRHLEIFLKSTNFHIKPYLRPLSSMTEKEGKELEHIFSEIDAPCWVDTEYGCVNFAGGNDFIDTEIADVYTDWLNKKMFDHRGLIPKGLALEALKGMYNTK